MDHRRMAMTRENGPGSRASRCAIGGEVNNSENPTLMFKASGGLTESWWPRPCLIHQT